MGVGKREGAGGWCGVGQLGLEERGVGEEEEEEVQARGPGEEAEEEGVDAGGGEGNGRGEEEGEEGGEGEGGPPAVQGVAEEGGGLLLCRVVWG